MTSSIDSALKIVNVDLDVKWNERLQRSENSELKHFRNRCENNRVIRKDRTRRNNIAVLPATSSTTVTKELPKRVVENIHIFQQGMRFIQFFGKIFGCQISYEWRPNPAFFCGIFFLAYTWSQFIYSQYLHMQNDEPMKLLEVFSIYGIGLSVVYKLMVYLRNYKDTNALLLCTHKICNENLADERAAKLKVRLLKNCTFYKWLAFSILLCLAVYVANPLKAFIVDGQFISLLPIEVMFVDQTTQSGFFIANFIMSLRGICSCIFVVFLSLVFAALIMNYGLQVDVIEEDFRVLDNMWNVKSDTTVKYRHVFLRNICQKQQDMDNYIDEVKKVYDSYIFAYFCSSYLSQIICLYEIVANDWKPGYGIAYGMFVLQQSNWYTYDLYSKRIYLTLYHTCLNDKELWIGPLAPLTVVTGTKIIKSIFGYYNVLVEVM